MFTPSGPGRPRQAPPRTSQSPQAPSWSDPKWYRRAAPSAGGKPVARGSRAPTRVRSQGHCRDGKLAETRRGKNARAPRPSSSLACAALRGGNRPRRLWANEKDHPAFGPHPGVAQRAKSRRRDDPLRGLCAPAVRRALRARPDADLPSLAELLAPLVLRPHQRLFAGGRQVLARSVDVEGEHGERAAKPATFSARASFGRPFQGRRNPLGIAQREDALIEAQRIAGFGHMARPTPTLPRRPASPRPLALAPRAPPRCSCFPYHRTTRCKWLSLRLNAPAQAMFRRLAPPARRAK